MRGGARHGSGRKEGQVQPAVVMSWRILKSLWDEYQQAIKLNSHYSRWKPPKATQVCRKHIIKAIARDTKWGSRRYDIPARIVKLGRKTFSIRIDKEIHELIKAKAKSHGLEKSEMLNIILFEKRNLIKKEFKPPSKRSDDQIVRWISTRDSFYPDY